MAEVARGHGGPAPISLDSDENLKPEHKLFCRKLRFTHFLEIFGQKKCLFGSKTVFLRQEVRYYMVYIAYLVNFANLRLRAKTTHLTRKL